MKALTTSDIVSIETLMKIAERVREKAISIAKSKNAGGKGWRGVNKNTVKIGIPKVTQAQAQVNITLSKAAAAYEWGSGIHGKNKQKYPITAKNSPTLVFMGTNAWAGTLIWWRKEVMHPGVAARPFLEPAKRATRKQNLNDIQKESSGNIRLIVKGMKVKV